MNFWFERGTDMHQTYIQLWVISEEEDNQQLETTEHWALLEQTVTTCVDALDKKKKKHKKRLKRKWIVGEKPGTELDLLG